MHCFRINAMVFLNNWIKYRSKVLVGIPISSIDATVLVIKLNCTSNCLNQSKTRCISFNAIQIIPCSFSHMLSYKWMLWLNIGELTPSHSFHCLIFRIFWTFLYCFRDWCFFFWLPQLFVFLPQSINTINHLLYKLNLWVSKPVFVGNVISVSSLTTWLSSGSSWLKMKFLTSCLQFINTMSSPARKINMNRCSHSCSKIGWAWVNVSILCI